MMRRSALYLAPLLALVGLPRAARAEPPADPAPPAPPPETAPAPAPKNDPVEVRVIGSKADSLQKVPGSGTVISTKDIERTQPLNTEEMLRRVPGLFVHQEEGGGFRLDVGVRGLDPGRSRRVLMLEDGIPITVNPYAESDVYYIPPMERMRGVEVVKGSGSILFGPATLGGVINFVTLAPPSTQTAAVEAWGGERGYRKGLLMYGDSAANGSVRYLVQGFYKEGDGFRQEAFNQTDIFGKMAFDTGKNGEATLKIGFHEDRAYSDDVGLTTAMYLNDPNRGTLAPADRVKQQRFEASLIHEQTFSERTKLRTLLYAYELTRLWRRQDYTRTPTPGTFYDHVVGDTSPGGAAIYFQDTNTILDRTYQVAGVEPRLETRIKTGPVEQTIDVGARVLAETAHYQQRSGGFPLAESGSNDNEEKHRTYAVAAYLQDRISLRKKNDMLVTPGIRVEHADFRRIITRQPSAAGTPQDVYTVFDSDDTAVIPGIGAIFGSRQAHVFSGLHVGYAPPRITSSMSPKGTPNAVSPEHSYNYEVGTRLNYKRSAHFETTLFYSYFTNQVISTSGFDTNALVNGGSTRHVGVEAAGTVGVGSFLKWKTALDLGLRYTFARATFNGGAFDGNLLPYAPLHNFGATVDVEHPVGFGAQLSWQTISEQFTDSQNTIPLVPTGTSGRIPAYQIVDLTARYRHKPTGLTLNVLVKGALNQIYISQLRPDGIHPAGYREVLVGLRWDFPKRQ